MAPTPEFDTEALRSLLGRPEWLDVLVADHPEATDGLARFTDAATSDGTLPGSVKWLYMAAVAAAKNEVDLALLSLREAFSAGLTREQADGAALTLLVSRGIPPCRILIEAADQVVPRPAVGPLPTADPVGDVGLEEARAYATEVHGEVPDRVQLMADELPKALEGYLLLRRSGLRETGLSPLHTELLLVAINSSLYEPGYVAQHAAAARKEGATDAELAEAVATAVPFGGLAAWLPGAAGIAASRPSP